jgi:hypothetical protein
MQLRCEAPRCFGRLDWVSSTPGPVPPPRPAPPSAGDIAAATTPVSITRKGSFCEYTLTFDRAMWTVEFTGTAGAKNYALKLDTDFEKNSRRYFEPPKHQVKGKAPTPISEFFVFNPLGSKDWIAAPDPLPENRRNGQTSSFGHGSGSKLPVRIQIGRQDENDQHSGSGLIHMMFAHDKDDLQGVFDVLRNALNPGNLGAIYRTKNTEYGHYRYFFLSRSNTPNCLVTEQHEQYYRVITLYKINGFSNYNKFAAKKDDYVRIYSWDKNKY